MSSRPRSFSEALVFPLVVAGLALALVVPGLSSYGIWDPWELNVADAARRVVEQPGQPSVELDDPRSPLAIQSVALGFRLFGIREWAGRLPITLWAVVAALLAYLLVARLYDRRAGLYAGIVAATTPLWVLAARQMLGETPAMAAVAAVLAGSLGAIWLPGSTEATRARDRALWALLAAAGVTVGLLGGGAMLTAVPALLGAGLASVMALRLAEVRGPADETITGPPYREQSRPAAPAPPSRESRLRALTASLVLGAGAALLLAVVVAVALSEADYSLLVGGAPTGGNPPTWERVIEQVAHAFVPWVALLPIAIGRTFAPPVGDDAESFARRAALRLALGLTAAFGFAAHTVFLSRYGDAGYVPVVALAGLVAIALRDLDLDGRPWRTASVVALLVVAVMIRDFALYPKSPLEALGISALAVPEAFNPKRSWELLLALFAVALYYPLSQGSGPQERTDPFRFERWLGARWRSGAPGRVGLGFAAAITLGLLAIGILAALGQRGAGPLSSLSSQLRRILMIVGIFGVPSVRVAFLVHWAFGRGFAALGKWRNAPPLLAAVAVAAYTSFGFMPKLSEHFSPREVYDTFNRLARSGDALGEYRVGGRAAAYYARGEVRELKAQADFLQFLDARQRRFVSFPADQLAELDRAYRARSHRHLFVVDARSARVLLAVNQPIRGESNQNVLARYVRTSGPAPEHRIGATFDGKIELVGYDLELPQGDYVGAGQDFTITWHWRALRPVTGGYQSFVHIDGHGQRLNGDHIPVDGAYPINLWSAGDYILDRQTLKVPGNYSVGSYDIFIGLFSGETRLRLADGPHDGGENRARVGVLVVR